MSELDLILSLADGDDVAVTLTRAEIGIMLWYISSYAPPDHTDTDARDNIMGALTAKLIDV